MCNYQPWWYWKSLQRYSGTIVPVNKNGQVDWIRYSPELIEYYCSLSPPKEEYYTRPIILSAEDFID